MSRIVFENQQPVADFDPGRADVACFVGLVRATGASLPQNLQDWLQAQGWLDGPFARPLDQLADVPIPIETWPGFTTLFDPGGSGSSFGTDYLAAAVRTFFAQGGKRCYVVRMDNPLAPSDDAAAKLAKLLPDLSQQAGDRKSWHGVAHLGGLPDASFLLLPDLPALLASQAPGVLGEVPSAPSAPEQFVECSQADLTAQQFRVFAAPAPRLAVADYAEWAHAIRTILQFLSNGSFREVQFVAAMPLPQDANPDIQDVMATQFREVTGLIGSISSAFLQLSYPWLKTSGSHVLLESLEPPDGALAGILARNALTRGTFTSAVKVTPAEIFDVWPRLPAEETRVPTNVPVWDNHSIKPLIERLSLFGFTPSGLRLLSDVTTYPGEDYRPARVNRLVAVVSRAARRLGEEIVFDNNGPRLWARVRSSLQQLMTRLWRLNALEGASVREAFSVLCDRSSMSQNDLDNGRLIAQVSFTAAATIELIHVTLALSTSGASAQAIAAALTEAA